MNNSFGKQLKMKPYEMFLFLLLMIIDVSTNAQEVTCEGEQLLNVDILFGNPSIVSPYKPGHILVFRCTDENHKMHGHRVIECKSDGKWDHPYPTCREVTCEGEQLINVDILIGHPSIVSPYKPGHIFVFRCTDQRQKMHGQRTIECLSDGKWNHPYPTCREVICEEEQLLNVEILFGHPSIVSPYKPGHILVFRCTDENHKMRGHRVIECHSDGKWDHPYPTCRGQGKCGPPPPVNDGDTTDILKKEYNTGERVEYICFSKYTLDLRPPFSKYLTCQQGEWSGNIKCLKPCTVTVEIMNERGVELAFADQQKLFAPHDDHITFKCQWGKRSLGVGFRQKCNDGKMTLPECV